MISTTQYWYELTYDVSGGRREEYDRWIPEAMIGWLERPEVEYFRAYRNGTRSSPKLKLVFQFADAEAWRSFAESDVHQANVERLRALGESVEERVWQPSAVPLDADSDTDRSPSSDPGPMIDHLA